MMMIFRRLIALTGAIALPLLATAGFTDAQLIEAAEFRVEEGPERTVVFAQRAEVPPQIDGNLDDPCWEGAVISPAFFYGGRPADNQTSLFAAFDDDNLYLAAICGVQEIANLKRDVPGDVRDGNVWGDDCLDFKLSLDGGATVMQFLANANGARMDVKDGDRRWRPEWACAATIGEDAYRLEIAIPLAEIGITELHPGTTLLFTAGRNDREAGQLPTAFGEPYGDVMRAAELVLGSPEDYRAAQDDLALTREAQMALYLDRDQYPSFQGLGTGRLRITGGATGPGLQGAPSLELALLRGDEQIEARTLTPLQSMVLDFDWRVGDLAPGVYEVEARLSDDGGVFVAERREFVVTEATVQRSGEVEITLPPTRAERPAWPITFGVPFPWGALDSAENVRLVDSAGREVPIQATTTGRWSRNGSFRWLLLDATPPVGAGESLTLHYGPEVRRAAVPSPLTAEETESEITINTGALKLEVPKSGSSGLGRVWLDRNGDGEFTDDEIVMQPDESFGAFMVDEAGTEYRGSRDAELEVALEEVGPLKACVRLTGWHVAESGERLGRFIVRIYAYRGLPYLRVKHTFIITAESHEARYRGIGYSLPFRSQQYFMGTPNVSAGRVIDPGAYLLQRDDLCFKVYDQGQFKEEGEKAEGWITVGRPGSFLTLAVRDFWQQFPKELEVTPDALNVHFWPAHGEEPIRTGDNLSIRNAYQLWFAHEGQVLDFVVPDAELEFVRQDSEVHNYPHAKVANAIGLAKTHEMLLYFHREDWETAGARRVNEVFQEATTGVVDPAWVCNTGVFGQMHPRDPERFPRVESALDDTIDNIMRLQEADRDYGMFNYGDSHHNWQWQERRWSMHRIWRATHHGWTRWPWQMYARTGDPRLLRWADANARHAADINHCHHTTDELASLTYPRQKIVGGLCDYKGFVHWASGGRLCYNSAADAMAWHWYVTGDRRSLTTALLHGAAIINDGRAQAHREGSGRATSAIAVYFLTWDNDYLEFFERTVDTLLGTQREDGSFPQWENFAPYLQRYIDLTQSRRGMDAMARWADWVAAQPRPQGGYHAKINILAHAYLYTGDEKYMRMAAHLVSTFADHVYRGADPRYYGQFITYRGNIDQSYFMQEVPYYLSALAQLGREPEPIEPTMSLIRTLSREEIDGREMFVFEARMRQQEDAAFDLGIAVRGSAGVTYRAEIAPLDAPGEAATGEATPEHGERNTTVSLSVPRDGHVDYVLRVLCEQNFYVPVPVALDRPGVTEAYPVFSRGTWVGDGFRYYFDLPDGAEEFTLRYQGRSWPLEVNIHDPSGEVVSSDIWIGSNDLTERAQRVRVGERGTTGWSFAVIGYGQAAITGLEASPMPEDYEFLFAPGPQAGR